MRKLIIFTGLFFLLATAVLAPMTSAEGSELRVGVLAKRGQAKAMKKWGPTADYLTNRLNKNFVIVPLKFAEIETALKSNQIDFLLANPAFYARYEEKYELNALATMVNRRGFNAVKQFGGVIVARHDSKINRLEDTKGKRFMCVKYTSFGGAHMAWRLLMENGINPKTDFMSFLEGGTHDKVVMAVMDGTVDVGTVRSDTLERMQDEGKIKLSEFKIINQIKDSFPFVHSTQLYPEWPFAACSRVDSETKRQVAKALILLNSTHKAMKTSKVYKWTYPSAYGDVADCLRVVGLL